MTAMKDGAQLFVSVPGKNVSKNSGVSKRQWGILVPKGGRSHFRVVCPERAAEIMH